eukprot:62379-Pelagomonas_calceolata.AAC.1
MESSSDRGLLYESEAPRKALQAQVMEAAQGLCDPGCCLCGTGTVLKILLPLHWCSSPSRTVGHLSLQIQQCSFQEEELNIVCLTDALTSNTAKAPIYNN